MLTLKGQVLASQLTVLTRSSHLEAVVRHVALTIMLVA